MAKNFKYANIEQSAEEHVAAENLATRVFQGDIDIEEIASEARRNTAVWRKKDKAAKRAMWKMLGATLRLSLAIRTHSSHMKALDKKCKEAGISSTKDTPLETLVVKFLFGCSRGLAYKYGAAIRGAILLELMPEELADRQSNDPNVGRLTLKYLIKVLRDSQGKDAKDEGQKAPALKWTEKARERFVKVAAEAPRLVCLVKQTEDGYQVTNVVASLTAVETFLKK